MVNLANLKKKSTAQMIESFDITEEPRPYLGMSAIGHECERFLWYGFRWCFTEVFKPRQKRLFGRGHREEPEIEKMLATIGIRCFDDQEEVVAGYGHIKGHCDGKSIGVIEAPSTVHLNEFKTMADKYFKEVCKEGVKVSKPGYYTQMQLYMKYLKLTRALFVAINKNDDAAYIERVNFDKDFAEAAVKRAEEIVLSPEPPPKRFKPTWYACKWCAAKHICHGNSPVNTNCRTCVSCDILPDGKWECSTYDELELATGQQRLGCKKYSLLPCLQTL